MNDEQIIQQALSILERRICSGRLLSSSSETAKFLRLKLATNDREVFAVIFLNNLHRVIAYEEMFFGTIDGSSVHPREVVKNALHHNASAVIFAHNHPAGVSEPSQADIQLTKRLTAALELVTIRVLDHMVVSYGETTSFAETGLLP